MLKHIKRAAMYCAKRCGGSSAESNFAATVTVPPNEKGPHLISVALVIFWFAKT